MRGAVKGADVFQAVPGQIFGLGDSRVVPGPWGRAEIATESLCLHTATSLVEEKLARAFSSKVLQINFQNYSFIDLFQTKPSAPTRQRWVHVSWADASQGRTEFQSSRR